MPMRQLLVFLSLMIASFADNYKYALSVCAIFKNEAPYFKEWIEYHKLVGVEHFYLYNNGSQDNFRQVLKPYIEAGDVTLIEWPNQMVDQWKNHVWAWVYSTQMSAYDDAVKRSKDESKWLAPIDIDEFIVPVGQNSILDVLNKYDRYTPAVEVKWRVYGTSNLQDIPKNKLLIESLNFYTTQDHPLNQSFKSIFKTNEYLGFVWPPHQCAYKSGVKGIQMSPYQLVINHYTNRTIKYFMEHKIKNKQNMDNVKYSMDDIKAMLHVGNDLEDPDKFIHKFVPELRKKLGLD
jgi:Glycosyltransferase family 92